MSERPIEALAPQPRRTKHTSNFPAHLERLGTSVLVTTHQAGKLVLLRAEGASVNTQFRDLALLQAAQSMTAPAAPECCAWPSS